jgi:hypothetical protein
MTTTVEIATAADLGPIRPSERIAETQKGDKSNKT